MACFCLTFPRLFAGVGVSKFQLILTDPLYGILIIMESLSTKKPDTDWLVLCGVLLCVSKKRFFIFLKSYIHGTDCGQNCGSQTGSSLFLLCPLQMEY